MKFALLLATVTLSSQLLGTSANTCFDFRGNDRGSYVLRDMVDTSGATMSITNELTVSQARDWLYDRSENRDFIQNFFLTESNRKVYRGIWDAVSIFVKGVRTNVRNKNVNKVFGKSSKMDAPLEMLILATSLFAGMSKATIVTLKELYERVKFMIDYRNRESSMTDREFQKFQTYMLETYNRVIDQCERENPPANESEEENKTELRRLLSELPAAEQPNSPLLSMIVE